MHPGKSLIDSLWPSRQSLRGHRVHITEVLFPSSSPRLTRQAINQEAKPWPHAKGHNRNAAATPLTPSRLTQQHIQCIHTEQTSTAVITGNMQIHECEHEEHGLSEIMQSTDRMVGNLLSGGTLSLCGQPDRLRWWGYRPVTWPVPSQPGVGHRLSFLSAREASVGRKSC